ncbi:MAG: hypothetical protein WC702_00985 [Patescibacteria group bacterium]|jgi:hypothetical protein
MSKTPNYDAKIKVILDGLVPGEHTCALTGEKWLMTDEEIGWYKKFNVPPSDISPLSRKRIIGGFMNGFQWWWQKHPATGAAVLSYVHPSSGLKVLPDQEWLTKDFSSEGREYDAKKSFFEQFREMQVQVPLKAANNLIEPEKSMALGSFGDIDSYFVIDGKTRESMFCLFAANTERSVEIHNVLQAVESYHVNDAFNVFRSQYVSDTRGTMNSVFAFIAPDCVDCFGVAIRKHKKNLFFNQPLTENEYKEKILKIDLGKRSAAEEWKNKYYNFLRKEIVWPVNMNFSDENSIGEYLVKARDCHYCYACVERPINLFHTSFTANEALDSAFVTSASGIANCYSSVFLSQTNNCRFCYSMHKCQNMEYSFECENCENCFGCVGLQHKKFHIFNKPYSEEEYWKRVDELKVTMLERGEYGKFFPLSFSPIYFLQSASAMYWLSTEKEAKQLGAAIYDPSSADAIGETRVDINKARSSNDIPDSIDEIDDSWCGVPIKDEVTGRYFTFLKPEIALYKKLRVAPPNKHFIRRMAEMIQETNSAVFVDRKCDKCGKEMIVSINKTFPEKTVYCIDCFNKYFEEVS